MSALIGDIDGIELVSGSDGSDDVVRLVTRVIELCNGKGHELCPCQIEEIARVICEDRGLLFGGMVPVSGELH